MMYYGDQLTALAVAYFQGKASAGELQRYIDITAKTRARERVQAAKATAIIGEK